MEPECGPGRVPGMDLTLHAPSLDVGARPTVAMAPPDRSEDALSEGHDVRSFDAFYASSRTPIGRAVALAVGDVDLASDATDEAMARAYERWTLVSRLERPEGWVYRVAVNWSVSVLRRRRRSLHRLYEPATADGPQMPDPALHDALGSLDVKHRSVVVCRHLLGWSVAETADALGVHEGTVKSRLHRALRVLQSRLGHLRDTEDTP
jgi:RNA polymerase sigma factor (sigma-70 family)